MAQPINRQRVAELLASVRHPELKQPITELGILVDLLCDQESISFTLRLLAGNDPFGPSMTRACRRVLQAEYPDARISIQVENPAQPNTPSKPRIGGIQRVRHIIAIASGKGGVGKSTLTANLAVALARTGRSVGLLDADVFGPSAPIMLGAENERPEAAQEDDEHLIYPIVAHGVKMLSMGFFVNPDDALIWRGPMASNALKQLLSMGVWGELDYLLIDLPPGTSDIHLTITQEVKLSGAIIITTPQRVALADAAKGISMLQSPQLRIPILGIVENMAWFEPEELPGHRYYIFGQDGAKHLAEAHQIPLLGQIPIVQSIREGGDAGAPVAAMASPVSDAFVHLAQRLNEQFDMN